MALKPTFTKADISRQIQKNMVNRLDAIYIKILQRIGEEAIAYARSINTYTDQTGNLRSSIGYLIYKNGREISKVFSESERGTDKKTGVKEGADFAKEIISHQGYALVVVAGMNYAYLVQSKGYDVLDGAESLAEKELKKGLQKIKDQINNWAQ